jgi:hypothetical protein
MFNVFQILTMICQILVGLANLSRRHARESLELLCQMTLTGEADL